MASNIIFIIFMLLLQRIDSNLQHKSLGCYEEYLDGKNQRFQGSKTGAECVHLCINAYFK